MMAEHLLNLALEAHQAGDLDSARDLYLQCLQQDPHNYTVFDLLGIVYAQCQDYTDAIVCFKNALRLQPNSANCLNHLASALKNVGQLGSAKSYFLQALAIEENYAEAHHNLANLYYQEQNYPLAIQHYLRALELKPNYVEALHHLALSYLKQQDKLNARKHFEALLPYEKQNGLAHQYLGMIAFELDELDQAIYHFEQILQQDPLCVDAHLNLAAALLKNQQAKLAVEHYRIALQIEPDNPVILPYLAAALLEAKYYPEAIQCYYELLTNDPDCFDAHYNLAVIFMSKRKWDNAFYHLQLAVKLQPENASAQHNMATVCLKLHKKSAAIEHFQAALAIDPHNEVAQYLLEALTGVSSHQAAPIAYVRRLFDNYAEQFDEELLTQLNYKVPQLMTQMLQPHLATMTAMHILDLGCGTGLSGEPIKAYASMLMGVDISNAMIQLAAKKGIYDQLIVADIAQFLSTAAPQSFDVILAADTLVYFGELTTLFQSCARVLRPMGLFAFTLECSEIGTYVLQENGRYGHHHDYVVKQLTDVDLTAVIEKTIILRTQNGAPVHGWLFIYRKNTIVMEQS